MPRPWPAGQSPDSEAPSIFAMNLLWLYRVCVPLGRLLPRRFSYWVALRAADVCYRKDHRGREGVLANLRRIFEARGTRVTEETLGGFVRKTYQYFGKNIVDFFHYSGLTRDDLGRLVNLEHAERIEACLAGGKGVIAVSAHFGCWELGGSVVAALGHTMNAVVMPQQGEKINTLFQEQRKRLGMNVIQLGRSPRRMIECLERNEVVALVADRDFTNSAKPTTFFGATALMPRGPAWLSLKTGAPILPIFVVRLVDDTFLFRVHEPILPKEEGCLESIQARICAALEKEIAGHPNQWFVFHDFWDPEYREHL